MFNKQGGYKLLGDVFHDSPLCKNGIAKVFFDPEESQEIIEYAGLNEQEMAVIASNPEFEILEHETTEVESEMGVMATHDLKVAGHADRRDQDGRAAEQFFIDAAATSIEDAYVCGQRMEVTVGELIEMGFEDQVSELTRSRTRRASSASTTTTAGRASTRPGVRCC